MAGLMKAACRRTTNSNPSLEMSVMYLLGSDPLRSIVEERNFNDLEVVGKGEVVIQTRRRKREYV